MTPLDVRIGNALARRPRGRRLQQAGRQVIALSLQLRLHRDLARLAAAGWWAPDPWQFRRVHLVGSEHLDALQLRTREDVQRRQEAIYRCLVGKP